MIFTRETRPAIMPRGTVVVSLTTPSTRKRTRIDLSSGSKWMSEAPRSTASATIERTSFTTGASSADSRSSTTGRSSASSSISSTAASRRPRRPRSASTSSSVATARRIS